MKCAHSTCSRVLAVDSSLTSFSGIDQSRLSKSTVTAALCSGSEPPRVGGRASMSTKRISESGTHPSTPDKWIAFMRASLVRIFQLPVLGQALRESVPAFGQRSSGASAFYDRGSHSWRTAQRSLFEDSGESLETWPDWGMTLDGACYPLPQLVRRTYAADGFALPLAPTLRAVDSREGAYQTVGDRDVLPTVGYVRLLPTLLASDASNPGPDSARQGGPKLTALLPTLIASDWRSTSPARQATNSRPLRERLRSSGGGQMNPEWAEWFMGWPIGATESRHLETDRSRSKSPRPGESSGRQKDER